MNQCTSKEKFNCIFLTKETRDEFLNMSEPGLKRYPDATKILIDNDKEVVIQHYNWWKRYYYNFWYVLENGEWFNYTQEEFKEYFNLLGDDNNS